MRRQVAILAAASLVAAFVIDATPAQGTAQPRKHVVAAARISHPRSSSTLPSAQQVAAARAAARVVVHSLQAARPVSPGGAVGSAFFGMHDPAQNATVRYGAFRVWDLGTTWADIERQPGVFDFSRLDPIVARAEGRGSRITLVLGTTPTWAAENPRAVSAAWLPVGSASPPKDDATWVRYVKTVAQRYAGRIDSYQIWNEASLPVFWRGTPARLARLTKLAARTISGVDRGALVVSTPMLPRQPNWSTWSKAYLRALRRKGWPVDVFAIHSYQRDDQANPDGRLAGIRKMKRVLRGSGAPRRLLWDTEANYSANRYAHGKVRGQRAADWVARTYLDSLRTRVGRTYWYAFGASIGHLGVTLEPGNAATRGYRTLSTWMLASTWRGCADTIRTRSRPRVTTCTFTRGLTPSYVVWASGVTKPPAALHARTLCTLLHGCRRVTKATRIGKSPVLLTR